MKTEKYLCICDYGQVRSAALAWYIHGLNRDETIGKIPKLKYEAIAIGSVTSSKQTMKMLKKWADHIIDVRKYIPLDTYGRPNDPELMEKVKEILENYWESKSAKVPKVSYPKKNEAVRYS